MKKLDTILELSDSRKVKVVELDDKKDCTVLAFYVLNSIQNNLPVIKQMTGALGLFYKKYNILEFKEGAGCEPFLDSQKPIDYKLRNEIAEKIKNILKIKSPLKVCPTADYVGYMNNKPKDFSSKYCGGKTKPHLL